MLMLQRNVPRCPDTRGAPLLRSIGASVVLAVGLISSCTVTREIDDLTAGCPDDKKFCGGECVPIEDPNFGCSPDACEPCQLPAYATSLTCSNGECAAAECSSEGKLCGDVCVERSPDVGCGRPGCTRCSYANTAEYLCDPLGECEVSTCATGWYNCDDVASNGCEINTVEDPDNCGRCGLVCQPAPNAEITCGDSACKIRQCLNGYKDCDKKPYPNGCEIDPMTDDQHCGDCEIQCELGQTCSEGVCQ